jgi:hypothetical protein
MVSVFRPAMLVSLERLHRATPRLYSSIDTFHQGFLFAGLTLNEASKAGQALLVTPLRVLPV